MWGLFWKRKLSTASRILQDTLGFRGARNLASWGVAGTAAYYLWVLPEQREQRDSKVNYKEQRVEFCESCDVG